MQQYYWRLVFGPFGDLSTAYIPPEAVKTVQSRWDAGQPIHLKDTASIPANQIREFAVSERPYGGQKLLEEAAQAFKQPLIQGNAVASRWVKQTVTSNKWEKYYSQLPGYRKLSDNGAMTEVAFRLPTHSIDQLATPYCTDIEVNRLTNRS